MFFANDFNLFLEGNNLNARGIPRADIWSYIWRSLPDKISQNDPTKQADWTAHCKFKGIVVNITDRKLCNKAGLL